MLITGYGECDALIDQAGSVSRIERLRHEYNNSIVRLFGFPDMLRDVAWRLFSLSRLQEQAAMSGYCCFAEAVSAGQENGQARRPFSELQGDWLSENGGQILFQPIGGGAVRLRIEFIA